MKFLTATAKDDLLKAAELIQRSFDWKSDGMFGYWYWQDFYNSLMSAAQQAPDAVLVNLSSSVPAGTVIETKKAVFHIIDKGQSLCGLKGDPLLWGAGQLFVKVSDKHKATCHLCKAKAPLK